MVLGPVGFACHFIPLDQELPEMDDSFMSENDFRDSFLGIEGPNSNQTLRDELLECYICTTENSTDPYDACFLDQSSSLTVACPDLSYTSCYMADSIAEIDGEVHFFMDRGCTNEEVGVTTGIEDTEVTEDGQIIDLDGTYTGL